MKKLVLLAVLAGVALASLFVTVQIYLDKKVNLEKPAVVMIEKGSSLTGVAWQLNRKNLIDYPRLFAKIGQFYGYGNSIKYGEYLIEPNDSYKEVLEKIVSGDNFKYEITFIEGDHLFQYARQVEEMGLGRKEEFIELATNSTFIKDLLGESLQSLEGYLFPETYYFSKDDGVKTIVRTMVKRFLEVVEPINFETSPMSRHQVITLASIVEKETGAGFERPIIASVFLNRIKKKMKLQTDPTIIYGIMDKTGREVTNIRKKDILAPTRYNTYVIKGLPPGPIANPGLDSIQAVLNPKSTEYLFFVSRNDGTHVFTTNYQDHLKAVKKFQLNPQMREGKSWRDLKKKAAQ